MRRKPLNNSNGQGERCFYCDRILEKSTSRSKLRATRDHYIPKSLGGTLRVWCCHVCNKIKADMTPEEWFVFMNEDPEWRKANNVDNARSIQSIGQKILNDPEWWCS